MTDFDENLGALRYLFYVDDAFFPLLPIKQMNRWQFLALLWMGIACLCLSLVALVTSNQSRKAQESLRSQQEFIGKGAISQQIGANLLREMATRAQEDEKMRDLLQKYGFNLSEQPTASPLSSP